MTTSVETKLDLMLAMQEELHARLKNLEKKYSPLVAGEIPKWLSTGEMGQLTNTKTGTITNWIYKGKIPKSILKKKTRGKVYNWLIDSAEGQKVIEALRLGIDYKEG